MSALSTDPENIKRWVVIKNWLVALDLIHTNPEAPEDALEILGLIEDLRNGEILCRLANRIKPGSVDSIQNESHTSSAGEHNVYQFTLACAAMALTADKIFQPNDLLMGDNLMAVLITLEDLYIHASTLGLGKMFTKHSLRRKSSRKMSKPGIPEDWRKQSPPQSQEPIQEHVVKALYPFEGTEEDELSFQTGDRIIVKNVLDGKWWEGECNGRGGWFPGNYVTDLASSETTPKQPEAESGGTNKDSSLQIFYNLDIQDLLDALRTYRDDLHHMQINFLEPLAKSDIISKSQSSDLQLNIKQLVAFETQQFQKLEEISSRPLEEQNVGEFIIENIPQIEAVYFQFSACHPKALSIITENSDTISSFIEKQGGASPGMITLSLYLGKPMKMLDKYVTQLMELERHIPETHKDLANMKEAAVKFKLLYASVQEVRKRKEVELEMTTSKIDNWGGKNLEELGDCYFSTQVYVNMDFEQTNFVLIFGGAMVILEVEESLSGYRLRELYELSSVTLSPLDNTTFYPIEVRSTRSCEMIYCDHSTDRDGILQTFDMCKVMPMNRPTFTIPPPPPSSDNSIGNSDTPKRPIQRSRSDIPMSLVVTNNNTQSGIFQPQLSSRQIQLSQPGATQPKINRPLYWGFKSLHPLPPARPPKVEHEQKIFAKRASMSGYKKKRTRPASSDTNTLTEVEKQKSENETCVLRVIESYNTTIRQKLIPRQTMLIRYNSQENQIGEDANNPCLNNVEIQINNLTSEISKLRSQLEYETSERKKLEVLLNISISTKKSPM
ncbi:Rho guanine nucleotide exchange factor 7 [Oopsacas minuta]|uniref:Rho guanine nucleotide exchange factor 7 n=1 Tax=Oopsacas minuta TaxID=111878 RepID=A0AAV7K881_9METZ|nr:Rho guanine nucleotide exchange factor 7 [Oopsacas minuta]